MIKTVIKRDGRKVPFDSQKIFAAVSKASPLSNPELFNKITSFVSNDITKEEVTVEEIQDLVEKTLVELDQYDTAKAYILYRDQRTKARDINSSLNKTLHELVSVEATDSDIKRENANIDGNAPMGIMLQFGSEISKKYSLDNLIKPIIAKAHKEGYIHIHDLNFYGICFNCLQIPTGKLLKQGFSTGHGFIREPNSIQTAAALMCILIQSSQNEHFGGQAVPTFEYDLAPYVAKSFIKNFSKLMLIEGFDNQSRELVEKAIQEEYDNKGTLGDSYFTVTKKGAKKELSKASYALSEKLNAGAWELTKQDTYQAMEALVHNLNTMQSRAGAQVPFSSINYGTGTTYEQRLVIRAILEATDKGLGSGETPIFPVQIFKLKDGVNTLKEDPNYDLFELACKVSAKRLFPNFSFIDSPYNLKYYKKGHPETELAVMGCFTKGHWIKVLNLNTFKVEKVEISNFVENYDYKKYRVWDSLSGEYVEILNVINNPESNNFYQLKYDGDYVLTVTEDHYFPLVGKGRTNIKDIKAGDLLYRANAIKATTYSPAEVVEVKQLKLLKAKSYCLETSSDRFDVNGLVSNNCRTRVMANDFDPEHEIPVGRGNVAFTTINLPRIGITSNHSVTTFYHKLDKALDIAFTSLMDRFNLLKNKHAYNFPFIFGEGLWIGSDKLNPEDTIEPVLKQGTLSIGFIGLAECLKALIGKHHGESEEAQKLGLEIISYMREYCDNKIKETGLNFSLFATPAEGLSSRFTRLDRKKFGVIEGVTDREYYTNSSHVPVYCDISAAKKIALEAPYHELCNAGHICYVEMNGNLVKNTKAFMDIILYMKKCNITYGSINHPVDRCPVCGFVGVIDDICPKCGRKDKEAVDVNHLHEIGCNCYK